MGAFEGLPFVRIVCVSAFVAAAMLKQVLVLLAAAQAVDIARARRLEKQVSITLYIPTSVGLLFRRRVTRVPGFRSSSLPKLFAAFNATDTLRVVPAVRSVGGNCVDLCRIHPLTKLQNSLARSNRSRFG